MLMTRGNVPVCVSGVRFISDLNDNSYLLETS